MAERHLLRKSRTAKVTSGPASSAWWYEEKGGITVVVSPPDGDASQVWITAAQLAGYVNRLQKL